MQISFIEPQTSKYISINPQTNHVHLLVPFIAGQDISTDNTCKATVELNEFFRDGTAFNELNDYKNALEFDISLLKEMDPRRQRKEVRLVQIRQYLEALIFMKDRYIEFVNDFLAKPSNLYSIQLRPREQDPHSTVVNPVFTVNRGNDSSGNPLSALYNSLHQKLPEVRIAKPDPRTELIEVTLKALPKHPTFQDIQRILKEQSKAKFDIDMNVESYFKPTLHASVKQTIDKTHIHELMQLDEDTMTSKDYIEAILGLSAPNLYNLMKGSPFYLGTFSNEADKTERLSIMTQFYLGVLNIYCRIQGISDKNFGMILDGSITLSQELVEKVAQALSQGKDIEQQLCDFFNHHKNEFGLSRALEVNDKDTIQQQFEATYRTVTATKENLHMDDFMLLDSSARCPNANFVTHKGLICTDFANIVPPNFSNQDYYAQTRQDALNYSYSDASSNDAENSIDIDPGEIMKNLDDGQWEQLPKTVQDALRADPVFQVREFLYDVAKGKQDEAKKTLEAFADKQILLRTAGKFTDYSGRTFNCTAYEYAYWAKDIYMCRMLEHYMNAETKAFLSTKINHVEAEGLTYQQYGNTIEHSKHFDLGHLIKALEHYIQQGNEHNEHDLRAACLAIGKAQREVPAHVAQEYCRKDRPFNVNGAPPKFKEKTLPRLLTFNSLSKRDHEYWFPLGKHAISGLGFDFSIMRGCDESAMCRSSWRTLEKLAHDDLAAIRKLDKVRSAELGELRQSLNQSGLDKEQGSSCLIA